MRMMHCLVLVLICAFGCRSVVARPYDVAMSYCGTGSVTDATVRYGNFRSIGGYLGEGGEKTQGFVMEPLPDRATVSWVKSNGDAVSREVDVGAILQKMPRDQRKNIKSLYVTITADDRAVARLMLDGSLDDRVFRAKMYPDALNPQYKKYVGLSMACRKGDLNLVKSLIESDAPLAWPDLDGHTPLIWSVVGNHADITKYLLSKQKKCLSAFEVESCLKFSAQVGSVELLEIFFERIPNDLDKNEVMGSVLTRASQSNQPAIITCLKKKGANLDVRTSEVGHTPVMTAVQSSNLEVLSALLEQGANPNPVVGGRSAYEWAREPRICDILKKYGGVPLLRGYAKLAAYRKERKEVTKRKLVHNLGKRIDNEKYIAPNNLFTLPAPTLSGEDVRIIEKEISPGITFEVRFEDEFDQALVVVCTKIRPDLPQDERVLDRVASKYDKASSPDSMDGYTWQKSKFGKMMSNLMTNQEYGEFFPYGFTMGSKNDEIKNLAVDRFIVFNGYLCEFAMIIPMQPDMDSAAFKKYAESCMDKTMDALSVSASKEQRAN